MGKQGPKPGFLKASVLHIVDVKPQVTLIYDGQDQAQHIFGLIGIGQVDLKTQEQHGEVIATVTD